MNVIVAGGRDFNNKSIFYAILNGLIKDDTILSGHASGADSLAEQYAKEKNLPCKTYPAKWDIYGKSAGPIRNEVMAKHADKLIAFWNQSSKGTKNMIELAKKYKLTIFVFDYEGNYMDV